MSKFMTADKAAKLIPNNITLATVGGGGGLVESEALLAAVEKRFLETGEPNNLRVVHSLGIGDRHKRGLNHLAHQQLVSSVIGGHWVWSPRMQQLAREEKIEAYVLPGGVMAQLMREIAAGRPGLFTHVGLGTFIDPRQDGGRMNKSAKDTLVELIEIDDKKLLRYKPFAVDVALLRGSAADDDGNISMEHEAANLETLAMAQAAHNSGGKVIFQVQKRVARGALKAREVRIPAALVDAIVVVPEQMQSHQFDFDPSVSGEKRSAATHTQNTKPEFNLRDFIASRAAKELQAGAVINYGFGIPDAIARTVEANGESGKYFQTIEHGTYGGQLLEGDLFGFARNPSCIMDSPSQFDFYSGGGLDIAFLGFGELDAAGNVNVSKLGGVTVGPGGFIDIAQNARKVVFCGTFEAKGAAFEFDNGQLRVVQHGAVQKLVAKVEQITFSGAEALAKGQEILYITERAVFELTSNGLVLKELTPGMNLERDVISRMGFKPIVF